MNRHTVIVIGVLCVGCGPLQEAGYMGEPLYGLTGRVQSTAKWAWLLGPESIDLPVSVGLFWARSSGTPSLEQDVRLTTSFPARYELSTFEPPSGDALLDVDWAPFGPIALGLPLLFMDVNEDGDRSDDEPLVGGAFGIHVLYATSAGTVDAGSQGLPVEAGFQRIGLIQDPSCDSNGTPRGLEPIAEDTPTDLWLGPAFANVLDVDCDGTLSEWDVCPTGDYLRAWCEQFRYLDPHAGLPCLDACGPP